MLSSQSWTSSVGPRGTAEKRTRQTVFDPIYII